MSESTQMVFWKYIENAREFVADGNLLAAEEEVEIPGAI